MADNLISIDPWIRSTFSDAWLSEAFTRDNEALTKALEKSLVDNNQSGNYNFENLLYSPEIQTPIGVQTPTPTVSGGGGGGGSEAETVASKGKSAAAAAAAAAAVGINGGKITKRKRRKSKRSTTIFISADPVNFRRMVQQVTGPKLDDGFQLPFFMPEPPEGRLDSNNPMQQQNSSYLPTFDTSAFLLEHTNQQQHVGPAASGSVGQPSSVSVGGSSGLPEVVHGGGGGADFGSFCSFPTLDSWNVI